MNLILKTTQLMSAVLLCNTAAKAQINLVPNPSFEEYDTCPQLMAELYAKHWYSANGATPDYFNSCSIGEVGIPSNIFGYQNAKDGSAYVGIFSSDTGYDALNYREYIQCKLKEQLLKGKKYDVKFHVSLADYSNQACNNLGLFFSVDPIANTWVEHFDIAPQVTIKNNVPITDKINWIEISGEYVAHGNESYLTIGVFLDRQNTQTVSVSSDFESAPYYFIDDVSVVMSRCSLFEMPTAFTPNSDANNDTFYLINPNKTATVKEFRVFNAWGNMVHDNPELPWDGTYNGRPQPPSTYLYYIYVDIPLPDIVGQSTPCIKTGSFTLIR